MQILAHRSHAVRFQSQSMTKPQRERAVLENALRQYQIPHIESTQIFEPGIIAVYVQNSPNNQLYFEALDAVKQFPQVFIPDVAHPGQDTTIYSLNTMPNVKFEFLPAGSPLSPVDQCVMNEEKQPKPFTP